MDLFSILSIGGKLLDKVTEYFPSAEAKDKAKLALLEMSQRGELAVLAADTELALGQLDVNKQEAASGNFLSATWRPLTGWVCALAFGVQYVIGPLVTFVTTLSGHPIILPVMDMSTIMPVLIGMLGLGGYRTIEKIKGAS